MIHGWYTDSDKLTNHTWSLIWSVSKDGSTSNVRSTHHPHSYLFYLFVFCIFFLFYYTFNLPPLPFTTSNLPLVLPFFNPPYSPETRQSRSPRPSGGTFHWKFVSKLPLLLYSILRYSPSSLRPSMVGSRFRDISYGVRQFFVFPPTRAVEYGH